MWPGKPHHNASSEHRSATTVDGPGTSRQFAIRSHHMRRRCRGRSRISKNLRTLLNVLLHFGGRFDTEVSVSLISESRFRQLWPSRPLEPSTVRLKPYTGSHLMCCGEPLDVLGCVGVHVHHGSNEEGLPPLIVKDEGPCLLGHNWLSSLQLDWELIHCLHNTSLEEVLSRYEDGLRWVCWRAITPRFMWILLSSHISARHALCLMQCVLLWRKSWIVLCSKV